MGGTYRSPCEGHNRRNFMSGLREGEDESMSEQIGDVEREITERDY